MGGRDELLRAGKSPGVLSGPPGEGHLERGELGARQLDLAHALLQGPGPASACGASRHGFSSSVSIFRRLRSGVVPTLDRPSPGRSHRLSCMPATKKSNPELGPTVFILFGATGDLAKRMVLPAFYRLAQEGLLPKQWLLVGNGRGDVAHEDFREHVRDALTEFGPKPADEGRGRTSPSGCASPAAASTSDNPGSLLDVLAKAREAAGRRRRSSCTTSRCRRWRSTELTRALGQHGLAEGARVVYEKPFGTSPESVPRAGPRRALGAGRAAGLPDRPLPGQGGHPGPARAALRQRPVRRDVEPPSTSSRCRSTCRRSSASPTGPCSTTPPARCSTCWSRTCSRSPPRWRWSRRPAWARRTCRPPGRR